MSEEKIDEKVVEDESFQEEEEEVDEEEEEYLEQDRRWRIKPLNYPDNGCILIENWSYCNCCR